MGYIPSLVLRTNAFPTSLAGKGHDTAVVSAWLEHLLREMDPLLQISQGTYTQFAGAASAHLLHCYLKKLRAEDCNSEILQVMRFTICSINAVFQILYSNGIFVAGTEAAKAVQHGFDTCVP